MLLTRTKRDRDRDGRERWVGRSSFTSVHVSSLWHQCSDAAAEFKKKNHPQKFLLNMHKCPLLLEQSTAGRYCLIWGVKLAGWVLLLPHPAQDQKKKKAFFFFFFFSTQPSLVSVRQVPELVSLIPERERKRRDLP